MPNLLSCVCSFQVDDPTKLVNGDFPSPLNATACVIEKDADFLNEDVSLSKPGYGLNTIALSQGFFNLRPAWPARQFCTPRKVKCCHLFVKVMK